VQRSWRSHKITKTYRETPKGGKFRRWESMRHIKIDFTGTGCGDVSWSKLAQDRDRWWVPLKAEVSVRVQQKAQRLIPQSSMLSPACGNDERGFILRRGDECGVSYYAILGAFPKFRKATISFVITDRPSVRPHATPRLPLDGFSLNLISEIFRKSAEEI
jgi:hypothetical protein